MLKPALRLPGSCLTRERLREDGSKLFRHRVCGCFMAVKEGVA